MSYSQGTNRVIAQSLALALAAAGAWALVVRPMSERLSTIRAETVAVREESERNRESLASDAVPPEQMVEIISRHTQRLQALCDLSADTSLVYDSIGRLADASGVRVERMEPRRVNVSLGGAAASQAKPRDKASKSAKASKATSPPDVRAFGFTIDGTGEYRAVAEFVDALERELGMSKVQSFRILPVRTIDGSERVRVVLETAHYHLDKPLVAATIIGDAK